MAEKTESAPATRPSLFSELDLRKSWEPFRGLMDDFFTDWPRGVESLAPRVDITETSDAYKVRAELAGVSKDDVTVEVEHGMLSLRGEKRSSRDEKTEKGRRLECSYGAFSRSFTLPQDADPNQISAEFKDGVLDIAIAKRPEAKAKQIAVKG